MRTSTRYTIAFFGLLLVIYLLLLDTLAKPLFESQASEMYGAEVRVDAVEVSPFVGKVTLHQLKVADRSDPMRNLAEAERLFVDIDMLQLAKDIIDVEELDIDGILVFAPRETPAEILRPLVEEDSDIATAGLPSFEIPDVQELISQQRTALNADIENIQTTLRNGEEKWRNNIDSLPDQEAIKAYKQRIKKIKKGDGIVGALSAAQNAREVYAEIQADLRRIETMRAEFRGDIAAMRETFALAADLPAKHTNQLIASLGLDSSQIAQIGSTLLRGDTGGLLEQILAPIAYSNEGQISAEETMPILIKRATIDGPLLPSGAGLSVSGELTEFAWPLEIAELPASLKLSGESLDGGSLELNASVDHRSEARDSADIVIKQLPLRNMQLAGSEKLNIFLQQSLANVVGNIQIEGNSLKGMIDQHYTATVFDIDVGEEADDGVRLIAQVLRDSTDFVMSMGLGGTVLSPELSFSANIDQLIASTIEAAISERVGQLTADLENEISTEIGPQIASARDQFQSLAGLEKTLQQNLDDLSRLSP